MARDGNGIWKRATAGTLAALLVLAQTLPLLGLLGWDRAVQAVAGSGQVRYVALTFDDGPRRKTTQPLLDGLAQRGVPATFFLIGLKVEGNEDLILRMIQEGHQVGVHAQNHEMLTTPGAIWTEVEPLRDTLSGLLGTAQFMVRPPYGKTTSEVRGQLDAPVILWSVDPQDWADTDTNRQVSHILSQVEDGDIILLHDVYPSSVDTALQVVDELLGQGFCFVTVEELFALRGIEPQPGKVYRCLPPQ